MTNALQQLHDLIKLTDNEQAHAAYDLFMSDLPNLHDDDIADMLQDTIDDIEGYMMADMEEMPCVSPSKPYLQSEFI